LSTIDVYSASFISIKSEWVIALSAPSISIGSAVFTVYGAISASTIMQSIKPISFLAFYALIYCCVITILAILYANPMLSTEKRVGHSF
jgi:hypothetical protein